MGPGGQQLDSGAPNRAGPWGFVSARVMQLRRGDSLALPDRLSRFVLVSGGLRIDRADAPPETVLASGGPVDVALPPGARWDLHALSDSALVLYTER